MPTNTTIESLPVEILSCIAKYLETPKDRKSLSETSGIIRNATLPSRFRHQYLVLGSQEWHRPKEDGYSRLRDFHQKYGPLFKTIHVQTLDKNSLPGVSLRSEWGYPDDTVAVIQSYNNVTNLNLSLLKGFDTVTNCLIIKLAVSKLPQLQALGLHIAPHLWEERGNATEHCPDFEAETMEESFQGLLAVIQARIFNDGPTPQPQINHLSITFEEPIVPDDSQDKSSEYWQKVFVNGTKKLFMTLKSMVHTNFRKVGHVHFTVPEDLQRLLIQDKEIPHLDLPGVSSTCIHLQAHCEFSMCMVPYTEACKKGIKVLKLSINDPSADMDHVRKGLNHFRSLTKADISIHADEQWGYWWAYRESLDAEINKWANLFGEKSQLFPYLETARWSLFRRNQDYTKDDILRVTFDISREMKHKYSDDVAQVFVTIKTEPPLDEFFDQVANGTDYNTWESDDEEEEEEETNENREDGGEDTSDEEYSTDEDPIERKLRLYGYSSDEDSFASDDSEEQDQDATTNSKTTADGGNEAATSL